MKETYLSKDWEQVNQPPSEWETFYKITSYILFIIILLMGFYGSVMCEKKEAKQIKKPSITQNVFEG